jgi:hypothetical protein
MGRVQVIKDEAIIAISGATARCKLQVGSHRRALVLTLIDEGGKAPLGKINKIYGFDCRAAIAGLIRVGWLIEVE